MEFIGQKIDDFLKSSSQEEKKKIKWVAALSALGIMLFLAMTVILPFKDTLFNLLYPKKTSQAAYCEGSSAVSENRAGFVYSGGDLGQEIKALGSSLYYTPDLSLGLNKKVFLIGKYANNLAGPLGLNLLMGDNLSNIEFQGVVGGQPAGWKFLTAGRSGEAAIETARENILSGQTSLKLINYKSPSGTQLAQSFKRGVTEGDLVVFGSWVKTSNPSAVKILLQNDLSPFEEFGQTSTAIKAGEWNYVLGYAKVPAGVTSIQLVLRVAGQESKAFFDQPAVIVIDAKPNPEITKLVLERCGSAWFVDDEPGTESVSGRLTMEVLTSDIYALIYHQFYQAIKAVDSNATVLPGGLADSPKVFLDSWRASYKKFFNSEPPLDAINLHYLANNSNRWTGTSDLENYLQEVYSYMKEIPQWVGKPIWISQLGVGREAPNSGADFATAALKFLENNRFNVTKWFWFDSCGFNSTLMPLFESRSKICTWPVKLTSVGQVFYSQIPTPTPAPTSVPVSPTPQASVTSEEVKLPSTASASATLAPTPTPVTLEPLQNNASNEATNSAQ